MRQIGLALGGGGAKGLAHVGLFRALEQLDIQAEVVTGTSMGGILGAMYALGLSVDRIEAVVRGISLNILAAHEPSHLGLFGKNKLARVLRAVFGETTFEQLPRKCAVVAVDLEAGREVVLDSGELVSALLATAAFPGLFAPERRDGCYLIDGGALNNVPFDVARHLGADYVIASNVSAYRPKLFQQQQPSGRAAESMLRQFLMGTGMSTLWEVVDRTVIVMQDEILKQKLATCPPDVMLCPRVDDVTLFSLQQLDRCIAAGAAEVAAHETALIQLREAARQPDLAAELASELAAAPMTFKSRLRKWFTRK